jgi:hypothetical protein
MIEIVRTNDPVELSWTRAVLEEVGIESVLLDSFTSVVEGSIGAIPRRLMVSEDDASRARATLAQARAELRDRHDGSR